jgi:hypothetical protein
MGGKMKKMLFVFMISVAFILPGIGWCESAKLAAPANLPNITRTMKNAGFWIGRQPFPDKMILSPRSIEAFNKNTKDRLGLIIDPAEIGPAYPGDKLREALEKDVKELSSRVLYDDRGKRVGEDVFKKIKENMSIDLVYKKCIARYGVITGYADQRVLPSDMIMTKEALDTDFDRLQNSSIDIGTPVVVLHESMDHKWVYLGAPSSWGWVKKDSVAFCDVEALKRFKDARPFVVVTSPKADIYLDGALAAYYDTVRMGAAFQCYEKVERGIVMMRIPYRGEDGKLVEMNGFMKRSDVSPGYLAYTPRSVIEQAFKLLNAQYGWGGAGQEQDCSAFLQEVFATVGIMLPRNSSGQAEVGYLLGEFSEKTPESVKFDTIARDAVGGITTLKLDGHIVLYLGIYGLKPYVIHATYGYGQKMALGDADRVLNRVVVSDLSLGNGSKKGSLLERLSSIRLIADQDIKGR